MPVPRPLISATPLPDSGTAAAESGKTPVRFLSMCALHSRVNRFGLSHPCLFGSRHVTTAPLTRTCTHRPLLRCTRGLCIWQSDATLLINVRSSLSCQLVRPVSPLPPWLSPVMTALLTRTCTHRGNFFPDFTAPCELGREDIGTVGDPPDACRCFPDASRCFQMPPDAP